MLRGASGWCGSALRLATAAVAVSCGGDDERTAEVGDAAATGRAPADAAAPPPAPIYPPEVRSLRLTRSIAVRLEPRDDAENLGVVARDTRVRWQRAAEGPGCDGRWIEIEPRGWVCDGYLEPSEREPEGVELPKLGPGEVVPGTYGRIRREGAVLAVVEDGAIVAEEPLEANMTVRRWGETVIEGVPYWQIGKDRYVATSSLRVHEPSRWSGVRLQDETGLDLPLGFAISGGRPGDWIDIYADAAATTPVRRIPPERRVIVAEEIARAADGSLAAVRIGEGEWLRAADLRWIEAQEPPPTTRPGERWIDIDLDAQTLVAYEGELPVYATLVSSGTRQDETETGIYRVWIKFAETDMNGRMGEADAYSVSTVPWTQFYANDLALHTSYWHDRFGQKRSHGCVNLAPRDARFLYFWSDPDVPRGWSMANGLAAYPGSMVRVRSAADPEPDFKGYAAKVAEARRGGETSAMLAPPLSADSATLPR